MVLITPYETVTFFLGLFGIFSKYSRIYFQKMKHLVVLRLRHKRFSLAYDLPEERGLDVTQGFLYKRDGPKERLEGRGDRKSLATKIPSMKGT